MNRSIAPPTPTMTINSHQALSQILQFFNTPIRKDGPSTTDSLSMTPSTTASVPSPTLTIPIRTKKIQQAIPIDFGEERITNGDVIKVCTDHVIVHVT